MGYRNYFAIIEKDKVDKVINASHDEQMQFIAEVIRGDYSDPDYAEKVVQEHLERDVVDWYMLKNYLEPKEIVECGKYFDYDTSEKIKEDCKDFSDDDTEFCIVKPESLLVCADHYRKNTINYYKNVIRSFDMTDEECENDKELGYHRPNLTSAFRSQIYDLEKLEITKEKVLEKEMLIDTWEYEYDMFNMIHMYKNIDWDKYYLVWLGY